MDFQGFPRDLGGFQSISMGFRGISSDLKGFQSFFSRVSNDFSRDFKGFGGGSWVFVDFQGISTHLKCPQGILRVFKEF